MAVVNRYVYSVDSFVGVSFLNRQKKETNERIHKIKDHLLECKIMYITGAVCLAVGVVGSLFLTKEMRITGIIIVIGKNNTLTKTTVLTRRGHPGNILRCNETGELFASQNRAASDMGIDPANLSRHLNGKFPNAGGYTFENLGEAA